MDSLPESTSGQWLTKFRTATFYDYENWSNDCNESCFSIMFYFVCLFVFAFCSWLQLVMVTNCLVAPTNLWIITLDYKLTNWMATCLQTVAVQLGLSAVTLRQTGECLQIFVIYKHCCSHSESLCQWERLICDVSFCSRWLDSTGCQLAGW